VLSSGASFLYARGGIPLRPRRLPLRPPLAGRAAPATDLGRLEAFGGA